MPPAPRLEAVALHLESRGDLRNLICFVERWNELGEPTGPARLAQARAFFELNMMDRSLARLNDLSVDLRNDLEALKLAIRIQLRRGWLGRARKQLEQARSLAPDDDELRLIDSELEKPTPGFDPAMAEQPDTNPQVLLLIAERYLTSGAFLKGRRILERLRRVDSSNKRVQDLLWVLEGDFSVGEISLLELTERHEPDLHDLADLPDEADHTESVSLSSVTLPDEPESKSFPALFRSLPADTEISDGGEDITQARAVVDPENLELVEITENTQPDSDTQILVVHHRSKVTDTPIHEKEMEFDSDFDLEAFRREMGMNYGPPSDFDGAAGIEGEDEAVIILTAAEDDDLGPRDQTGNLDLIDLDPTTDAGETSSEVDTAPSAPPRKANPWSTRRFQVAAYWLTALMLLLGLGALSIILLLVLLLA